MKNARLIGLLVLAATTLMLSGCVWERYGDGRGEEHHHERDRGDRPSEGHGDHHGDEHDDHR